MQQTFVPSPSHADGKPAGVSDSDIALKADITYVDRQIASAVAGTAQDRNFVFTQAIPADVWVVNHNLGKFPSVTVVDSDGQRVIGGEQHISVNQVVLSFSAGFSGKAYCN